MLTHIAKLIWNRKLSNVLIIIEVLITFLVLFGIMSFSIHTHQTYNKPLGFDWKNTWTISVSTGSRWNNETDRAPLKSLVEMLRQQNEFSSVSMSTEGVFISSIWTSSRKIMGKQVSYMVNIVNQDGPKDWGVELIAGRWFGEQDDGQNYTDIMVSRLFVEEALQNSDPIGFEIIDPDRPEEKPFRIVGVFEEFRQLGHFEEPMPYVFLRYQLDKGTDMGMRNIYVKFNEKMTTAYEEKLLKLLKGVAPTWEFNVKTWESLRSEQIKETLIPLSILVIIVVFLLVMVAMGLFGVLWQNISRRTQEIGLRRAIGASSKSIQLQIIGELIFIALLGIAIAFALLIQVPLLELIHTVTWSNFWLSMLASISAMLFIVIICAIYPSKMAIKLTPANALHYE